MKLEIVSLSLSLSLSLSVPSRCRNRSRSHSWLIFAYMLHCVIKCIGFGGNAKIESMVNTPLCFEMSLSTLAIFFTPLPFKTSQFQVLPHSPPWLGLDSDSGSTPSRTTRPHPRPLKTLALVQIQRPAWHNPEERCLHWRRGR